MNCGWYEERIERGDVELWRNGRPSAELVEHARSCAECDRLVAGELELRLKFGELAESSRNAEPGAAVKSALLRELESKQPRRLITARWIPRVVFGLAALIVLVAGVAWLRGRPQRTIPQKEVAVTPATPERPVVAQAVAQKAAEAATRKVRRSARETSSVSAKSADKAGAPTSTANDFYPVMMCDSLSCAGPTVAVRVEMPASPLAGTNRKVLADLLVGEDGQVRGVRVLQ